MPVIAFLKELAEAGDDLREEKKRYEKAMNSSRMKVNGRRKRK